MPSSQNAKSLLKKGTDRSVHCHGRTGSQAFAGRGQSSLSPFSALTTRLALPRCKGSTPAQHEEHRDQQRGNTNRRISQNDKQFRPPRGKRWRWRGLRLRSRGLRRPVLRLLGDHRLTGGHLRRRWGCLAGRRTRFENQPRGSFGARWHDEDGPLGGLE